MTPTPRATVRHKQEGVTTPALLDLCETLMRAEFGAGFGARSGARFGIRTQTLVGSYSWCPLHPRLCNACARLHLHRIL